MTLQSLTCRLGLCLLLAISGCLSVPTRRLDWALNDMNDNRHYYMVSGDTYYKLTFHLDEIGSGKASDLFPGLPSGIQAATYWPRLDKYYFFKDGKYYCANAFGDSVTGPFEGSSLGEIFTRPIDAATTFRGKTYFYQEGYLYEFRGESMLRRIKASRYRLPRKMDAALTLRNKMFFFEEYTAWTVYPYKTRFTVRNFAINMYFDFETIHIG